MSPSLPHRRIPRGARTPIDPAAEARRKYRRAGRPGLEALESRVVMDAALYSGGLEFLAVGLSSWSGSQTSNEVRIGLKPTGTPTPSFKPLLDVPAGSGFQISGSNFSTSSTTVGSITTYASSTQTPTTLFTGAHSFKVDSTGMQESFTATDSTAPTTSFNLAGQPMTATQVDLSKGTVQVYGSIPIFGGLALPVSSTNPVTVSSVPNPNPSKIAAVTAPSQYVTIPNPPTIQGGGASFDLEDVKVGYDPAVNKGAGGFYLDGTASVTFGALGGVAVTLGNEKATPPSHGLVFDSSGVSSVDATVNPSAKIQVGGLTLTPQALTLNYTKGGDFDLTGGATLSQQGGMSLSLGLTGNGLMLDSSGNVSSVDASVSSVVGIDGVIAIQAEGLTLSYDASGHTFSVWGGINVTIASARFQSIQAALGDQKNPGLTITNGGLTKLNVGLSGAFSLFGVTVMPQGLTLAYDATNASDPVYKLSGGLQADLTSTISVGGSISSKTPLVIHSKTGAVDLNKGFGVSLDGSFKGFSLDATVSYQADGSSYDVLTKGTLTTPGGIGFDAYLHMTDGTLSDIGIGVSGKIAVGETGVFITWVYGSLNQLDTDDPTITAAATLVYGSDDILRVTGAVEINKEHLLVSADPAALPAIYTSGQVSAADHPLGVFVLDGAIGQLAGSLDLDWGSGVYSVHASGNLLDGLATIDVGMTLSDSGNLSFSADVGIGIPQGIPLIGGLQIASGHVRLEYKNGDLDDSYVAAWGTIIGLTAGVEYNLGTLKFSFLDATAVSQLNAQAQAPPNGIAAPHVTFSTTVNNTTTASLQFIVSDPYFDNQYPGSVTPDPYNPSQATYITKEYYIYVNTPYGNKYGDDGVAYGNGGLAYTVDPTTGAATPGTGDLAIPATDTVHPIAGYANTARILTLYPPAGYSYMPEGTYTLFLQADISPRDTTVTSAAKAHIQAQPLPPEFRHYDDNLGTEIAPVATQVDSDTIDVSVPVVSCNPNAPITVSLYATNSPLPPGADPAAPVPVLDASGNPVLDANGKPEFKAATLIVQDKQDYKAHLFMPGVTDVAGFTEDVQVHASQLPTVPDGKTPVYFYAVVSDGFNHPVFDTVSNPITPPSLVPTINLTTPDIVTDFKSPYVFAPPSGFGVAFPIDAPNATSVRVTAGDGTVLYPVPGGPDDNQDLRYAQLIHQLVYTPPASGIPAAGYDTVTVTAYNQVPGEASPFVTTRVIRLLPPNNVDLSVSQLYYGNSAGIIASTYGASLGSRPITPGETVTIHLAAQAAPTPAGGAATARGVTVKFPIPAGLTYVSATGQGSYNPTTGIWTAGNLTPGGGQAWINLTATVNAGTAGTILTSTATAVPGTNTDGTPQPDINPSNLQSTTSFYVGSAVTGQVMMVDSSPQSVDTTPHPAAGLTVYELAANVADNAEYLLAATTTDANGRYAFAISNSPSSSYPVIHIRIYGVNDTTQVSADYTVGSVPSYRVTTIQPATISGTLEHERYPTFSGDTGNPPGFSAKSGGLVYLDLNNDGIWEANEPSTTTDANGSFVFHDVVPGIYTVRELIKPGRVAANDDGTLGSDARSVRVTAGQSDDNSLFDYIDQITLQGHVFNDVNGNGVFDQGEPGLSGWIIDLDKYLGDPNNYDPNNVQEWWWGIQTSVTDAAGKYYFADLSPGIYRIRQRQVTYPGGPWTTTVADAGVGPDNFIEVTQSGDIQVMRLVSDAGESFYPVKDTGANHLSHIDFGNEVTPASAQVTALTVRPMAIAATAAAGDTLRVTAPSEVQAGEVSQFTVTAIGPDGNPDPNFTGTVDLASSDDSALLDTSYTFQPSDSGSHTFGFTLFTLGTATVDAAIDGDAGSQSDSDPIAVLAGQAADCLMTTPTAITPGQSYRLEINPVDHAGDTDVNYWGVADITTSLAVNGVVVDPSTLPAAVRAWIEGNAGLPASYHFTLQDQGDHTFQVPVPAFDAATIAAIPGMSGPRPGSLSLVVTITDPDHEVNPADATIPIAVATPTPAPTPTSTPTPTPTASPTPSPLPAPPPTMAVSVQGPAQVVAGLPLSISVAGSPRPGTTADATPHGVRFLSTDPRAALPVEVVLTPGGPREALSVTFATPGIQTLTAVDAATGAVLGRMTFDVQAAPATAQGRTVDAIYQALLGHPADPKALAGWGARLSRGVPASRLARAVTRSREYAESQVADVYRTLLGRAPSAAEGRLAVARIREGGSIRGIQREILGGREYDRLQGGQPSGFLAAAARDVLGRALTPVEQSRYAARLARGASRASVAGSLLRSPAALDARVVQLYEEFLGRSPSTSEAARAADLPRTPRGQDIVTARLVDSAEFRAMASGQAAPAPSAVVAKAGPSRTVVTDGRSHPVARLAGRLRTPMLVARPRPTPVG